MPANKEKRSIKTPLLLIYCVILLCGIVYAHKKQTYNWDMMAYMVVLLSYDHVDFKTAHDSVYALVKNEVPEKNYRILADTADAYRNRVMKDAAAFREQIPYYVVKPLYTGICYLFYKAGSSLIKSTIWPGSIAYFFIGLLVFSWLQKYTSTGFAFAGGLAIMFCNTVFSLAFLSTPDALSALLILLGVFFIIEKKSIPLSFIFLFLSVFARVDNLIPSIFILAAVRFSNRRDLQLKTTTFLLLCGIICLAYFLNTASARSYGWDSLFYTSILKQINPTNTVHSKFIFSDYLSLAKSQFMTGVFLSSIGLFIFLTLLLAWGRPFFSFRRLTAEQAIAVMFIMAIGIRFILEPHIVERIYAPYYVSILIFLMKKYILISDGSKFIEQ